MRQTLPLATLLFLFQPLAFALQRTHHLLAEDLYAFPKYRVVYLNGLPVLNETAEIWLRDGLRGGELEFLEQAWQEGPPPSHTSLKSIESSTTRDDVSPEVESTESMEAPVNNSHPIYRLERMKLSQTQSYLCLIPPPVESASSEPEEDLEGQVTPSQSLSLLQSLTGKCLYHRQGWFTYSYCHNHQVRQFREATPSHPVPPDYTPEEDPEWESFTLGRAPTAVQTDDTDLTVAQQDAVARTVEVARGPGHSYLVQRWGDGTLCDRNGKPREIEIQFHCSMTMTDTVLLVKESKTCRYEMVIHTPRLCGEPGFKNRLQQREETHIRCREILDADGLTKVDKSLPETTYPLKLRSRTRNTIPSPPPAPVTGGGASGSSKTSDSSEAESSAGEGTGEGVKKKSKADAQMDLVKLALQRLFDTTNRNNGENNNNNDNNNPRQAVEAFLNGEETRVQISDGEEEGEVVIQFLEPDEAFGEGEFAELLANVLAGAGGGGGAAGGEGGNHILDSFKASNPKSQKDQEKKKKSQSRHTHREEL